MATDKKITELEELTPVDDNDWVAVVDASETDTSLANKKARKSEFKGDTGTAATIQAGTTTTGAAGTNASVVNAGTTSEAVFNFTIPRGDKGETGETGETGTAATADVHSTETGVAGTDAIVTNEGTTSAAEFKFIIPRGNTGATGAKGDKGDQGDKGMNWQGEWSAGTYNADDTVQRAGTSYIANKQTNETPSGTATDWDVVALKGVDGDGSGDMLASVYDPAGGGKQVAFDDAVEKIINKKTTITESDVDYPTTKAVFTALAGKQATIGYTPEDSANKTTSFQSTPDDTKYPTEKLVKDSLDDKLDSTDYTPEDDLYSVTSVESSATPTPTGGSKRNEYYITALADAAEFAAPSGTPANGNMILIRIKDAGTAKALTYNAIYEGISDTLPATTVISKTMFMLFAYNSANSKWQLVSLLQEE